LATLQVALPPLNVEGAHVGAVPDGGVTVHVTVPVGAIPGVPFTVTFTWNVDPGWGFDGVVTKLRVGVALVTAIVVDPWLLV
jgi:hypothetical protein